MVLYFQRKSKSSSMSINEQVRHVRGKNRVGVRTPELLAHSHSWFPLGNYLTSSSLGFLIYKIMKIIAHFCGRLNSFMAIINGISIATPFPYSVTLGSGIWLPLANDTVANNDIWGFKKYTACSLDPLSLSWKHAKTRRWPMWTSQDSPLWPAKTHGMWKNAAKVIKAVKVTCSNCRCINEPPLISAKLCSLCHQIMNTHKWFMQLSFCDGLLHSSS